MNPAQTWMIRKMTAWHEGPYGGRCPRVVRGETECSQHGIGAVRRYGAVVGVLVAARYVATCKPDPGGPDPCPFKPAPGEGPGRWASVLLSAGNGSPWQDSEPSRNPFCASIGGPFVVLVRFFLLGLFGVPFLCDDSPPKVPQW